MKVEIFTLCDAATVDSSNRLNILGSFDRIFAKQTPITYPLCALAVKLRFEKIEAGNKTLKISFVDTDGKHVLPTLNQTFTVQAVKDVLTASHCLVLVIQQLKFENYGDYSIDLAIDGRHEGSIPLYIRKKSQ